MGLFLGAEMGFFLGADMMEVSLFAGRMLDNGLLAEVFVKTGGQFLLGLRFLLDFVSRLFEGI